MSGEQGEEQQSAAAELPHDVIGEIFQFLSENPNELLQTAATVNQRWWTSFRESEPVWLQCMRWRWPALRRNFPKDDSTTAKEYIGETTAGSHQRPKEMQPPPSSSHYRHRLAQERKLSPSLPAALHDIENCSLMTGGANDMEGSDFQFTCPMFAEALQETGEKTASGLPILHCGVCNKNVHTVASRKEADQVVASGGSCVRFVNSTASSFADCQKVFNVAVVIPEGGFSTLYPGNAREVLYTEEEAFSHFCVNLRNAALRCPSTEVSPTIHPFRISHDHYTTFYFHPVTFPFGESSKGWGQTDFFNHVVFTSPGLLEESRVAYMLREPTHFLHKALTSRGYTVLDGPVYERRPMVDRKWNRSEGEQNESGKEEKEYVVPDQYAPMFELLMKQLATKGSQPAMGIWIGPRVGQVRGLGTASVGGISLGSQTARLATVAPRRGESRGDWSEKMEGHDRAQGNAAAAATVFSQKTISDATYPSLSTCSNPGAEKFPQFPEGGPEHSVANAQGSLNTLKDLLKQAPLVSNLVATIPIGADDLARTKRRNLLNMALPAAQKEGDKPQVLRVINEPTAAAIAHHLDRTESPPGPYDGNGVVILDVGANGARACSLLIEDGIYEVLETNSCHTVGGRHFDLAILGYLERTHLNEAKQWTPENRKALLGKIQRCRIQLSEVDVATIELPAADGPPGAPTSAVELSRSLFETIVEPLLDRIVSGVLDRACKRFSGPPYPLRWVLPVGGFSYTPALISRLRAYIDTVQRVAEPLPGDVEDEGKEKVPSPVYVATGTLCIAPSCGITLLDPIDSAKRGLAPENVMAIGAQIQSSYLYRADAFSLDVPQKDAQPFDMDGMMIAAVSESTDQKRRTGVLGAPPKDAPGGHLQ